MRATRFIALLALVGAGAAAVFYLKSPRLAPPAPQEVFAEVTRAESLAMAERYVRHEWRATEKNIFHGTDASGITVNTPDAGYHDDEGKEKGWWKPGEINVGIPYKWGGFDLPEEFDAGLLAGKYAGDAYSKEKRRLLDDGVSLHAVGIDCSGFVSRCWNLPRSYSTRELPQLCDEIADWAQLRPGDIFNKHNAHVRLFAGWADEERTRAITYEAASKVRRQEYAAADMLAEGYSAWRYKNIKE